MIWLAIVPAAAGLVLLGTFLTLCATIVVVYVLGCWAEAVGLYLPTRKRAPASTLVVVRRATRPGRPGPGRP